MATKKPMRCFWCGMQILATTAQATRHGWKFWMGGARCPSCADLPDDVKVVEAKSGGDVNCMICLADEGASDD